MIDAHTHIQDDQFDADREVVIRRAFENGVTKMLAIGTSISESKKAVGVAEEHENIWAVVGIHPNEFDQRLTTYNQRQEALDQLEGIVKNSKVVGIGEIGLDYYSRSEEMVTQEQKQVQREYFLAQVNLAKKYNLPVVIHARPSSLIADDAYLDIFEILDQRLESRDQVFILHSYQGDTEVTQKFLELPHIFFSFAGNVTYPIKKVLTGTKNDIRESVRLIPIDRILTETDCPYLAPQPVRGTRNEPSYVKHIIEEIAQMRAQDAEDREQEMKRVERETEKNFEKIFGHIDIEKVGKM